MNQKKHLLLGLVLLSLYSSPYIQAGALSTTKIGPVSLFQGLISGPVVSTFEAASTFRPALMTPASAAITIGGGLLIMAIGDGINSLKVQAGATSSLPSPVGWSDANTPPVNSGMIEDWTTSAWGLHKPTALEACQAGCVVNGVPLTYCVVSGSSCSIVYPSGYVAATSTVSIAGYTCPTGYTLSGGNCNLTTPLAVQWPSDGFPTLSNTGAGFTPNPRDPDNGSTPSSSIQDRTGTDSHGNPVQETVQPNAASGVDYIRKTQSQNSTTGQPSVQLDKFSTDSAGNVMSVTTASYDNSTITNINTNSTSTSTSSPIDISTLSKESTQLQIKDLLKPPDTQPDISQVDAPYTAAVSAQNADISGTSTNLASNPAASIGIQTYWTYASGTCFPAVFEMGRFGSFSLEKFCGIYDEHIRPLLVWVLGVLGMLHAFSYWSQTVKEI